MWQDTGLRIVIQLCLICLVMKRSSIWKHYWIKLGRMLSEPSNSTDNPPDNGEWDICIILPIATNTCMINDTWNNIMVGRMTDSKLIINNSFVVCVSCVDVCSLRSITFKCSLVFVAALIAHVFWAYAADCWWWDWASEHSWWRGSSAVHGLGIVRDGFCREFTLVGSRTSIVVVIEMLVSLSHLVIVQTFRIV